MARADSLLDRQWRRTFARYNRTLNCKRKASIKDYGKFITTRHNRSVLNNRSLNPTLEISKGLLLYVCMYVCIGLYSLTMLKHRTTDLIVLCHGRVYRFAHVFKSHSVRVWYEIYVLKINFDINQNVPRI